MPNVPNITPGPDDTEHTPEGATETLPLITDVHADKESGRTNDAAEITDEEAYAKLRAKRAERRRKKLIRRGIAAGVVGLPFCRRHGRFDQRAGRPIRKRGRRAYDH